MKELIIVGAGGCGREVLQWAKDINKQKETWLIKGFIDDNERALEGYECEYKVIGTIKDWKPSDNEEFVVAVGNTFTKEKIVSFLKNKQAKFASIVHPRAIVADHSDIGEGVILYPNAMVGPNATVGDFVLLLSSVGHDAKIGNYATISSFCDICGYAELGDKVFLASHVTVIPGKKLGEGAYAGAGSVIIHNVKPNTKVFGNPAKKIDI